MSHVDVWIQRAGKTRFTGEVQSEEHDHLRNRCRRRRSCHLVLGCSLVRVARGLAQQVVAPQGVEESSRERFSTRAELSFYILFFSERVCKYEPVLYTPCIVFLFYMYYN